MQLNETQINNRVQWVSDLVSGDFGQATHSLKKRIGAGNYVTYGYCCLGVACERIAPNHDYLVIQEDWNTSNGVMMPEDMARNKFGMSGDDQDCAATWNDQCRFKFPRIADLVAYATAHELDFNAVENGNVPDGYANTWLGQFTQ